MASVQVMYGVAIVWVSSNSAAIPYAPRTAPYILTYGAEVFVVEAIPVASRSASFRVHQPKQICRAAELRVCIPQQGLDGEVR